ncbi:MAG: hypothetical protein FWC47_03130 [Oscillospiraceae bacterium]|nr:hypothetical protein [Oscillospiraceae bacterium]
MKIVYRTSIIIHLLVGIGAMSGGFAAISNPNSPLGMSVDALKNSPFSNFLIPGIFLFCFIGLGNIFGAFMFCFKSKFQGYISGILGGGLALWIIIQCIMLSTVVSLHVIFFIIGLIQGVLALILLYDKGMFPFLMY